MLSIVQLVNQFRKQKLSFKLQVETDLLTGATAILLTDLTYDCGKSLKPAII
ncbi:putative oxidoreductase [Dioscorea sansibarensis]